jgi:Glu-tRNA(Gln) amidotransferase subunit E-like FAD-binding protein
MGAFGFLGYWAHIWDERAQVLIAEKEKEIKERQERIKERKQAAIAAVLQEVEGRPAEADS